MRRGVRDRLRRRAAWGCLAAAALLPGCAREGASAEGYRPVASIDHVMDAIVIPSSQAVFDAVVYENGELAQAPKTDDDWFRLQMHALAVAEAGNLLLIPGRAKDAGDWRTFAQAMTAAAAGVASAAESQDVEAVLQAGSDMYRTCVQCHQKYLAGL